MKDRIKQIREQAEDKKLSQSAFGERIGLTRDNVANIEGGRVEPTEIVIKSIVREFSVNEDWLRTGQGEMYSLDAVEKQTAEFLGHAITHNTTAKDSFLRAVAATDEKTLQAVLDFMSRVAEEIKAK